MTRHKLADILHRFPRSRRSLVGVLHAVQDEYRCLPQEAVEAVAARLGMTAADVVSVASFYPQFRFTPAGRHRIKVCVGTACHVKGAEAVYNAVRGHLGIAGDADTDADGLFTVEQAACLGCCMLAPAVQIDTVTYGYLTSRTVPAMIADFLKRRKEAGRGPDGTHRRRGGPPAGRVSLCTCSSCAAAGADKVYRELEAALERFGGNVVLVDSACSGLSFEAPLVEVAVGRNGSEEIFRYGRVTEDAAAAVVARHFRPAGRAARLREKSLRFVERVLMNEEKPVSEYLLDLAGGPAAPYWGAQLRIVTEGAQERDPLDLDAYRAAGGFEALAKVVATEDRMSVIRLVEESGLRGRGGAGFPTGKKWRTVFEQKRFPTSVVCNGDEGDPGAFMDRMVIESFPFRVIEGVAIAAAALGAAEAFVYVRTEYPLALSRLRRAVALCEESGYLGADALGPGRGLALSVIEGGGAFVCGEETALLASIEGRRGTPRLRPPFPAESGLDGHPTLINNVETFAAVPWIVRRGAGAFAAVGNGGAGAPNTGTKTFALAGKIRRGGLIEVPLGMSLREIVFDIGGGVQDGRALKAVQIGGPSGGLIPASLVDLPVDYEALREHGAMMGSGGLVVLDETDCMVEIARYFMAFSRRESCGACAPCRVGTARLLEILAALVEGRGTKDDLDELESLAGDVRTASRCGLGRNAPNPVLTALGHFRPEFEAHLSGRCPAGACKALVTYSINDTCIGCTRCAQACPAEAIAFTPFEKHVIDSARCTRCDSCRQVCPSGAVVKR
ncbi:MAG: NAD(P)H-dependent oxidoreductase subunit E [Spirochaetales bacterium]|nr:NAD(P)H-dependent oxidoreductase subunit E [Spirochaetales bacterium]